MRMRWLPALLAALITLHQPSGEIYVNPDEIMLIKPCARWYCGSDQLKAAVLVHDKEIFVLETPAEVKRLRDGE